MGEETRAKGEPLAEVAMGGLRLDFVEKHSHGDLTHESRVCGSPIFPAMS